MVNGKTAQDELKSWGVVSGPAVRKSVGPSHHQGKPGDCIDGRA